jgi:hypothetical protein
MGMATLADTDRLHLVRATTGLPDRQAARLVRDPVRAYMSALRRARGQHVRLMTDDSEEFDRCHVE